MVNTRRDVGLAVNVLMATLIFIGLCGIAMVVIPLPTASDVEPPSPMDGSLLLRLVEAKYQQGYLEASTILTACIYADAAGDTKLRDSLWSAWGDKIESFGPGIDSLKQGFKGLGDK